MKATKRYIITAVLLVLGLAVYLMADNRDYFLRPNIGSQLELSEGAFINWQREGSAYVSQEDPQLVFTGVRGYVDEIRLSAQFDGTLEPQVYYTTEAGEEFSEEKSFFVGYAITPDEISVKVDKAVYSLRVDLTEQAGIRLPITGASRTPAAFRFSPARTLLVAMALGILLFLGSLPEGTYRALWVHIKSFKKFTYLLNILVKRDITVKYRRSVLGVLWSVLNPLLMMLVITAVFRNLFRFQVENFPMYYLTGSLLFNFTSEATSGSMTSIVAAGPLLRKVYIPKYIFPLEKCLFALINMLFAFAATLIMLAVLGMEYHWTLLLCFLPFIYTFVFSVGLGLMLATLNVFFRDTSHLYAVWITAWMYLTPIIYPVDILPQAVLSLMQLNPLYHYVDYLRQLVMYGTVPGLMSNAICAAFALVFLGLGLLVFKRKQDRFILYI